MTAATLSGGISYNVRRTSGSEGVSEQAIRLAAVLHASVASAWRTASGQSPGLTVLPALSDRYREAAMDSVHGDQSLPAPAAMHEADLLLGALPTWCAAPAPLIEPSGAIAFEWDMGPNRWLVLALKGTGTLEHSAILGQGIELHGTTNFSGSLGKRERDLLLELMQLKA